MFIINKVSSVQSSDELIKKCEKLFKSGNLKSEKLSKFQILIKSRKNC